MADFQPDHANSDHQLPPTVELADWFFCNLNCDLAQLHIVVEVPDDRKMKLPIF